MSFHWVRTVLAIWVGTWLLNTLVLLADEPAPKQLTIANQYWQILQDVRWVYLDHAGEPWFSSRGGDVAASYDKPLHTLPEDERMLLGDSKGRIWVSSTYRTTPARYYDGSKWHETDIQARLATEDAQGRVFLLDATTIHVLDGDQWSRKQIFAQDTYSDPHFLKDAEGRIWFWAAAARSPGESARPGTRGLWVFKAGEWLNHNTDNGLPIDDIEALLPLDNDRFLVVRAENGSQVNKKAISDIYIWSSDRKLNAKRLELFPSDQVLTRLAFIATDPDGRHFFLGEGGKSKYFFVSANGAVEWLLESQVASLGHMLKGLYENRRTFYSRIEDKPPPAPAQPREVICQDRQERIYFRHAPYLGVGVLWPSQERGGDTLRIAQARPMRRVLRGTDGTLWGQPRDGFGGGLPGGRLGDGGVVLSRWEGAGWQDTPVQIPPYPKWDLHPSPPWNGLPKGAVLLPGANGSFLVVAVRSVYQDAAAGMKKDIVKADEKFWLEAWLLKDGKWLGPQRLKELLKAEHAFFVEHFNTNSRQSDFLSIQSDGKHLWVAYGGQVFVHTVNAVANWNPPERLALNLPASSLCRMPDGRMLWCTVGTETQTLQLFALTYDGAAIAAEPLSIVEPLPPYMQLGGADDWYPHATKSGDLWLWLRDRLLQFRDGKWVLRKDLDRPLHEEPDGSLWFLPGSEGDRGYRIVKGRETLTYTAANNYGLGLLTPAASGELHAVCGYWLVTLSAAETPLKREVIKARIADQYLGVGHAFELEKGRFLFDNGYIGSESQIKVP